MTMDQLFDKGKEIAQELFKEKGRIRPLWLAETESGQLMPIMVEMPDRDHRNAVAEALIESFKRHKVVRYVSILESWVVSAPIKEKIDLTNSLEYHKDRREAVFVQAEDISGEHKAGFFYILRPEHGPPTLSPFDELDSSKPAEGRFASLLNAEQG